jgi:hypothetical protein
MKKTVSIALLAALCAVAGASFATVHVECKQGHGKCVAPAPPAPPTPPAPPALPAPPAPPAVPLGSEEVPAVAPPAMPAMAAMPAPPAIPAPPPPPKLPEVPAGAHAACAGKAVGSEVTYTIRQGEYMRGVCEREDGKMVFQLRLYHLD